MIFSLLIIVSFASCEKTASIDEPVLIHVTGKDYKWEYTYPDFQNFENKNETEVIIPAKTKIRLEIYSQDNVYMFTVPELQLIEMAIPNKMHFLEFSVDKPEVFDIEEGKMCGFKHDSFLGKVIVLPKSKFKSKVKSKVS